MVESVMPEAFTPGTKDWLDTSLGFARDAASFVKYDCVPFARVCKELKENRAWESFFDDEPKTWERLCKEAISETDSEFIDKIIEGVDILKNRGRSGIIPGKDAIAEARENPLKDAKDKIAGPGRGNKKQVDNVNLFSKGGNSSTYLLKRLSRDNPEILDDLEAGKYPSVRQAAIAAGIVKVKTPFQHILFHINKLNNQELSELLSIISDKLQRQVI